MSESINTANLPTKQTVCLKDSKGSIYALTCTSDGEYIISGGMDKTIRLYNPHKSLLIKEYKAHGYDIQCIKIENNTKSTFASCGGDKSIFIWDINTGKILRKLWGHSQRINCLAFNQQNNIIVSGSFDQTVLFYDLKSYNKSKPFYQLTSDYFKDSVTDIYFSEYEIFICSIDGYLRIFDIRNGKLIKDFICDKGLTSVSITEDTKCVLLSCLDDKLRLINKLNGKLLNDYTHKKFVNNQYKIKSGFGFDDGIVMSGTENGNILMWDLVDTKIEPTILDNNDKTSIVTNVLAHPKRKNILFSSDTRGQIKMWN
eukprot:220703_1